MQGLGLPCDFSLYLFRALPIDGLVEAKTCMSVWCPGTSDSDETCSACSTISEAVIFASSPQFVS